MPPWHYVYDLKTKTWLRFVLERNMFVIEAFKQPILICFNDYLYTDPSHDDLNQTTTQSTTTSNTASKRSTSSIIDYTSTENPQTSATG